MGNRTIYTNEIIENDIKEKGFNLLSINNIIGVGLLSELKLQCKEKHIFKKSYQQFRHKSICPYCEAIEKRANNRLGRYFKFLETHKSKNPIFICLSDRISYCSMTKMFDKDLIKIKKYGNEIDMNFTLEGITPSLLGSIVQMYFEFKTKHSITLPFDEPFKYNIELLYKQLHLCLNDKEIINYCIIASNELAKFRSSGLYNDNINLDNVAPNDYKIIENLTKNISKFFKTEKLEIVTSEISMVIKDRNINGNDIRCNGDLDFITNKGILDIKCVKNPTESLKRNILQQISYYIMIKFCEVGYLYDNKCEMSNDYIKCIYNVVADYIKEVGIYNPFYDEYYYIDETIFKNKDFMYEIMVNYMLISEKQAKKYIYEG